MIYFVSQAKVRLSFIWCRIELALLPASTKTKLIESLGGHFESLKFFGYIPGETFQGTLVRHGRFCPFPLLK
jgi:hypothetical protein